MNIRTRLLLVLIVAALVPLYLAGWLALRNNAAARAEREDAALTSRANEMAADVEAFVRGSLEALRADAGQPIFERYLAAEPSTRVAMQAELRGALRSVAVKDPIHVMSAALLDADGQVLGDTALAQAQRDPTQASPCAALALDSGLGTLTGPRIAAGASTPFIHFCQPVRNARGHIIGLLRLRVSAARLQAIVWRGTLNEVTLRRVLVLGREGVVVAHSGRPEWVLRARVGGDAASDQRLRQAGLLAPEGAIERLAGQLPTLSQSAQLAWVDTGADRLRVAVVDVRDTAWRLVVLVPEAVWQSGSRAEITTILLLGAVLTVLLLLAAWFAAGRIAAPIVSLTALADQVGLAGPAPRLPVQAGGEVGRLARAIQAMTERLEDTLARLAAQVEEQRATASRLQISESRFAALFNLSPLPLLLSDRAGGEIVDLNAAFITQFGDDARALPGQCLAALRGDARYPDFEHLAGMLDTARNVDALATLDTAQGPLCLRIFARAFEAGDRPLAIWTCVDVTETERARQALEALNASLETRVEQRTTELRETLARLQLAQDELVRSEKLVALGGLVAGVAHELNTPIGNSVTVASTISELTARLVSEMGAGQLRRSQLEAYVQAMQDATNLIERNLARARTLVTSFKQVSVDRVSEARRSFDLADVVGEVTQTLAPGLRGQVGRLELVLSSVPMDSYPGAIGQIVTNLVNNAMLHAFEGREAGQVVISSAALPDGTAELCCRDDGCGMDAETLRKIFDPFFTTKFGRGGSGLGMHIVYNLVTRVLGGRIHVESRPGEGALFRIVMPRVAPAAE